MKFLKFAAAAAAFIAMLLFSFSAFAAQQGDYSFEDNYIQSYDVSITVGEDNTLDITESINVYFNKESHGIYRTLPLTNYIEREDGSTATVKAKVKNLSVSEEYETYSEDGSYVIQIGSENETVLGEQNYIISYSYVMGRDVNADFDELYYNIIGSEWDAYIENVTFTITMPKEFDSALLGFSTGYYGSVGSDYVDYSVDSLTVTGALTQTLSPGEGFTVRLQLPDGYFYFNLAQYYAALAAMVAIPAVVLIAVIIMWLRHGKDKKVLDIVEFYPPAGMSSTDVAYWYKGYVENTDVVPLLIELANEGCVNIIENKSRSKFIKNDFVIERVRDYDSDDENKKIFFNGLFKSKNTNHVTKSDLEDSFYMYINQIVNRTNTRENRLRVFSKKSLAMRVAGWLFSILGACAVVYISYNIIGGSEKYIFAAAGLAVSMAAFVLSFFLRKRTDEGHAMLQRINGFKLFLKNAEKARLEALVEDNPKYFYDILPFAYVLGVSREWTKKFEGIAMEPPGWYGGSVFDYYVFCSFMSHTMRSATSAMAPPVQSQSPGAGGGGGFSGGGFAGGGAGGGGGGSW
ncbi:MAG: DUF2207 domain-containing protein [Clostridiales bacterium]|nr:DUF2207 domain-containing protein [Clostridiales bacterium]